MSQSREEQVSILSRGGWSQNLAGGQEVLPFLIAEGFHSTQFTFLPRAGWCSMCHGPRAPAQKDTELFTKYRFALVELEVGRWTEFCIHCRLCNVETLCSLPSSETCC